MKLLLLALAAAASTSCTCTLNGEEAAKSVVYIYKYTTK